MDKQNNLSPNSLHVARHRFDVVMSRGLTYAGVDEVGRGCLAGPVVAAAIVPPQDIETWALVNDSKRLPKSRRKAVSAMILKSARAVGLGTATSLEIDRLNILQATKLAMKRAVLNLDVVLDIVLVDGNNTMDLGVSTVPVVRGDARSLSIAAASIVAKVYRDEYMRRLDKDYPQYGFFKHVGYGTKAHIAALKLYGPISEHRVSFAPVRNVSQSDSENQSYG